MLLNCLEKGSGLPKERLILCAGNHDVSQKLFKDDLFLDNALKDALSTSSSTNQFLDKRESGHYIDLSLRPLSNYLNFESSLSEGLILNLISSFDPELFASMIEMYGSVVSILHGAQPEDMAMTSSAW